MEELNILTEVKSLLGISESYTVFDKEILSYINMALTRLIDLSVFKVKQIFVSKDTKLESIIELMNDKEQKGFLIPYIYYDVRLTFDPPQNTNHIELLKQHRSELEWRLRVECDQTN